MLPLTAIPRGFCWGIEVMRRIAVPLLGVLLGLPVTARADILVTISKSQQRMSVVMDGAEAYRWPVSTGTHRHATPAGHFRPFRLERHWYSRQYSLTPMPWAMFFHRGYAVHGTMEAYNLGRAASHGCVRLRPDNAAILYSLLRREGLENAKFVVLNGPLPAVPGAVPMAEQDAPPRAEDQFAAALPEDTDHLSANHFSAKTHADADKRRPEEKAVIREERKREPREQPPTRYADIEIGAGSVERYRVSVGSEARVLREREAWLRALDRKYGFVR